MLGDKAYDSAELRLWLEHRGTKPVIPNRSNSSSSASTSDATNNRHRIENAFSRLRNSRRINPSTTGWRETSSPQYVSPLLLYGGFNEFWTKFARDLLDGAT